MIRTVRCELGLLISTLEIDPSAAGFARFVNEIFHTVRSRKDYGSLAPDREFAVHENIVKVGRYRPFSLLDDLERSLSSSLGQAKSIHEAHLTTTIAANHHLTSDGSTTQSLQRSVRFPSF